MLKTILIGLDGSPFSEIALEMALDWGRRFDAMLVGLSILDEPPLPPSKSHSSTNDSLAPRSERVVTSHARRKAEAFLGRFSVRCAQAGVACKVLEDNGRPWEVLVRESQRYDLVLLGKKTYFHFETVEVVDDTLHQVLRFGPRPVVTTPEVLRGCGVLVAYDGSLAAARAVQALAATGLDEGEEVHVVAIDPNFTAAAECAGRAVEFLGYHDIKAAACPVAIEASPADVLLKEIRRLSPRLLVMGAYGRSPWRELLFGSTTRTLLKVSPVPLLLSH
jgi:nucleotide-binding universal stress UspA family protein